MAQYEEFTVDQGADFAVQISLADRNGNTKNLVGYNAAAKLKRTYNSDSADTVNFGAVVANPGTRGLVVISLTNEQTDLLKPGRYVYDVELSHTDSAANTIIERILEGTVTVTPSVTR